MITYILFTIISIIAVILLFFVSLLLLKQPKKIWMLIPSIILGLILTHFSKNEFESDLMAYTSVFPLVLLSVFALLYNFVDSSSNSK